MPQSVTRNGWSFSRVMSSPLTSPTSSAEQQDTSRHGEERVDAVVPSARRTGPPQHPTTEPIDRSMPPVMMTSAAPRVMMP